jgi:hypothetical protein
MKQLDIQYRKIYQDEKVLKITKLDFKVRIQPTLDETDLELEKAGKILVQFLKLKDSLNENPKHLISLNADMLRAKVALTKVKTKVEHQLNYLSTLLLTAAKYLREYYAKELKELGGNSWSSQQKVIDQVYSNLISAINQLELRQTAIKDHSSNIESYGYSLNNIQKLIEMMYKGAI